MINLMLFCTKGSAPIICLGHAGKKVGSRVAWFGWVYSAHFLHCLTQSSICHEIHSYHIKFLTHSRHFCVPKCPRWILDKVCFVELPELQCKCHVAECHPEQLGWTRLCSLSIFKAQGRCCVSLSSFHCSIWSPNNSTWNLHFELVNKLAVGPEVLEKL